MSRENFDFIRKLGNGAYGTVYLVEHKKTHMQYAVKELSKEKILKHNKINAVFREQDIHE
jgi:serine/threonine protein kinase